MSEDTRRYDDIIHLPHRRSPRHPRMPALNRAAQFAPFAALTGYGAVVAEAARLTQREAVLGEDAAAELDRLLQALAGRLDERPQVLVTWFVPDERKEGGEYVTGSGALVRLDLYRRVLVLSGGRQVPIDRVADIQIQKESAGP